MVEELLKLQYIELDCVGMNMDRKFMGMGKLRIV